MPKQQRQPLHLWMLFVAVLALTAVGLFGWQWLYSIPVQRIEAQGMTHADADALLDLAAVDTTVMLYDQDPLLLADRVQRHPWVAAADVDRLPTGTLIIDVAERVPALLVLSPQGRPAHYLDADGYQMPLVDGAAYDVPVLRGLREAYNPVRPVQTESIAALLATLHDLSEQQDALLDSFVLKPDGDVWLYTSPTAGRASVPVRLGTDGFGEKLDRLEAYWHRAVLTRPETTFSLIDLRFDSQVVTREG